MKEFNLKIIEDINFTTYDFDSKLSDYETSADAIIGAGEFILKCRKFGVPCNVFIKDNKKHKVYTFEEFKKIYGK